MTPAAQIRAARKRLAPPGAWLPVSFSARAADGREVQARASDALAWGTLAAIVSVTKPGDDHEPALAALRHAAGAKWLCDWEASDGRTQAEVLGLLDRAATDIESGGRCAA